MLVFLASLVGCAASSSEAVVLPPTRIGSSDIKVEFETKYTFASAISEADAVARIEVGNWLGEDTDLHKTYYEATVLQCFKGDIPNKFTLLQDGCSTATLKNYPLFTNGNELLVFLNKATVTDYDSPYWIIGSFMTVLDVAYDASGTRYYSDRYGILGETVDVSKNFSLQDEISAEVYSELVETDSIIADMRYSYPYIFSENDLIPLLENQ
jgi:hypothetical protein